MLNQLMPFMEDLTEEQRLALMRQAMLSLGANMAIAGGQGQPLGQGIGSSLLQGMQGLNQSARNLQEQALRKDDQRIKQMGIGIESARAGTAAQQAETARMQAETQRGNLKLNQRKLQEALKQADITLDDWNKMDAKQRQSVIEFYRAKNPGQINPLEALMQNLQGDTNTAADEIMRELASADGDEGGIPSLTDLVTRAAQGVGAQLAPSPVPMTLKENQDQLILKLCGPNPTEECRNRVLNMHFGTIQR